MAAPVCRKTLKSLISHAKSLGLEAALLQAVDHVNEEQKKRLGEKIEAYFQQHGGVKGKKIAILGLSFNRIPTTSAKPLRLF